MAARAIGVLLALGWGSYVCGMFRTQQVSFSVAPVGIGTLFILPATLLPFLGLRLRELSLGAGVTLCAAVGIAETLATREESDFLATHRTLPRSAGVVFQDRQWPFENHYMSFEPATGRIAGGD